MKKLIAIAAIAFASAAHAEVITLATAYDRGYEIELYNVGPECPKGLLGGGKFPEGERHNYVLGCWRAAGDVITINFTDGSKTTLTRRQLIPRARSGQML